MKSLSNSAFHANCPLCQVAHHDRFPGNLKAKVHYEDDEVIVLDCTTCHCPMAVLKRHTAEVSDEVRRGVKARFVKLFGEGSGKLDDQQQCSMKGHYHTYWRP